MDNLFDLPARRLLETPAVLSPLTAKMHAVEVHWRLENTERLVVGPEPKLVLAVRARRDVELLTLRVDYPKFGDAEARDHCCEAVLVQVPHVAGKRRLRPARDSEPWVHGQEDIPASAMFTSDCPEERASQPEQIRWWGGTVEVVEYNRNVAPCIWWCWRGRVYVPKGQSVGLIVRSTIPTPCRAMLAGV